MREGKGVLLLLIIGLAEVVFDALDQAAATTVEHIVGRGHALELSSSVGGCNF